MSDELKGIRDALINLEKRRKAQDAVLRKFITERLEIQDAILREFVKRVSRAFDELQATQTIILDRLGKFIIAQNDKRETDQLSLTRSELTARIRQHLANLEELKKQTEENYNGVAPWHIENQIILEKRAIAELETELRYV